MTTTEILAVLFTFLSVWLTAKRHILSWPVGLIAVGLYSFVFFNAKLYADFGLQFIFFWQGVIGWIIWRKNLEDKSHTKIEFLSTTERISWLLLGIACYVSLGSIMDEYTDASVPWVDSFVTVFSLIANWLLAKRKIENWWIWICVDVIYIFLFGYKQLYLSSFLYLVLLFLAIQGFKNWNLSYKEE